MLGHETINKFLASGGETRRLLLASFFVPIGRTLPPSRQVEEWARTANVEWLRHTQYGFKPKDIVAQGLWGGTIPCEFYIADLDNYMCILLAPFYQELDKLITKEELHPLFQKTCLSLKAEVMVFSFSPTLANFDFVKEEYLYVLSRDSQALLARNHDLLYLNEEMEKRLDSGLESNRESRTVPQGGMFIFGNKTV